MFHFNTKLKILVLVMVLVPAVQGSAMAGYNITHKPSEKVIEITAQKFKFDPSVITVNKGDTVTVKVDALTTKVIQ